MTSTHLPAGPGRQNGQPRDGTRRWRVRIAVTAVGAVAVGGVAGIRAQQASAAVSPDTGAYYVIVNANSGKALDLWGGSTANGGEFRQSTRTDDVSQQFQFVSSGSSNYRLKSRSSGKVVEVWGSSTQDGAEVRQYTDSNKSNQQFSVTSSDSNYVTITNRNSGKALEVSGSSTSDGAPISQSSSNGSTAQDWQLIRIGPANGFSFPTFPGYPSGAPSSSGDTSSTPSSSGDTSSTPNSSGDTSSAPSSSAELSDTPSSSNDSPGNVSSSDASDLVGWATQNGGTTGGSGGGLADTSPGASVNVSSASDFLSAISSSETQTVRLTANISLSGMNKVSSNKTIIGSGSGKTITGGGLTISGQENVIIQNLNFTGWSDDAINVESSSTNIWIDHCSFSNGYDGTIDIKRGSDFITVSWNHMYNHDKAMLLGHSDDNGSQDTGHLHVSYHHNWFDGTSQRHPRVRFGNPVHVFNNYYLNNSGYGVASTEGAGVLVEGNYFEGVKDPYHLGEGNSGVGTLVARNNYLTGSGQGETSGSVDSIPYGYSMDEASSVKSIVTAGAGVGHLNL